MGFFSFWFRCCETCSNKPSGSYLHDRILSQLLTLRFRLLVLRDSFPEAMAPKVAKVTKVSKAEKADVKAAAEVANQLRIDQTTFLTQTGGPNATPDQKAANQHYK